MEKISSCAFKNVEKGNSGVTLHYCYTHTHTHLPGASLCSHQIIHSDDRDPEEDKYNHAPAQSQAPDWELDVSKGGWR